MTMGAVDLRDVDWVLINRITEWHREHYLCSTTRKREVVFGVRIVEVYPYLFDGITGVFGVLTRLATHDVYVPLFTQSCDDYS